MTLALTLESFDPAIGATEVSAWVDVPYSTVLTLAAEGVDEAMVELLRRQDRGQRHLPGKHDQKTHGHGHGKGGTAVLERPARQRIGAEGARGNSRSVSIEEFDALADEGDAMLATRARNATGTRDLRGLDDHWQSIKDDAWSQVQQSWGGATVDAATGRALPQGADRYALSVKPAGVHTTSVPEAATRAQFDAAMDTARSRYHSLLDPQDMYLGIFHDDDLHRIDIDPVTVVSTVHEVEAIGAATHAIGGAYHFASGNGFWPPHVSEERARRIELGEQVHWKGPGQWHSYAVEVQGGQVETVPASEEEKPKPAKRYNPLHDKKTGKFTFAPPRPANLVDTGTREVDLSEKGRVAKARVLKGAGITDASLRSEIRSKMFPQSMEAGARWYPQANTYAHGLAAKYGISVEQATGVISAVSPRCPWPRNQWLAERILAEHTKFAGMDPLEAAGKIGGGLHARMAEAIRIARGDPIDTVLTGAKRRSFYNNILHPGQTDDVTVDAWMSRAAMNTSAQRMSVQDGQRFVAASAKATGGVGAGYVAIADATRAVADEMGLSPDAVQSAYWLVAKGDIAMPAGG